MIVQSDDIINACGAKRSSRRGGGGGGSNDGKKLTWRSNGKRMGDYVAARCWAGEPPTYIPVFPYTTTDAAARSTLTSRNKDIAILPPPLQKTHQPSATGS